MFLRLRKISFLGLNMVLLNLPERKFHDILLNVVGVFYIARKKFLLYFYKHSMEFVIVYIGCEKERDVL